MNAQLNRTLQCSFSVVAAIVLFRVLSLRLDSIRYFVSFFYLFVLPSFLHLITYFMCCKRHNKQGQAMTTKYTVINHTVKY